MIKLMILSSLFALSLSASDDNTTKIESLGTQSYNLSEEADFDFDKALDDFSELKRCEDETLEYMEDEAYAIVDFCPTKNISIRLGHPIIITDVTVSKRKITTDTCSVDATFTLTKLPMQEVNEIEAVCKEEYEGYGASLMLQDGLWQGIQIGFGVGYSGGGIGTFNADFPDGTQQTVEYQYYSAPMIITDATYLYKLPIANLYILAGAELGWIFEQTNKYTPNLSVSPTDDGGSPYIFRFGLNTGFGYRFLMSYDIQAQIGYQFQYLHRTINGWPVAGSVTTFDGFENNIAFGLRGAYHFHENFAFWVKAQHNTVAPTMSVGLAYEFWD